MYNLDYIVNFPTRINDYTETTDNIFPDRRKNKNFITEPYCNRLSDHDAQMLTLYAPHIHLLNLDWLELVGSMMTPL